MQFSNFKEEDINEQNTTFKRPRQRDHTFYWYAYGNLRRDSSVDKGQPMNRAGYLSFPLPYMRSA